MKVMLKDIIDLHQPINNFVIDCGGYLGEYTYWLLERFDCPVIIFEPISEYAEICRNRFHGKNVRIINKAVGKSEDIIVYKSGESSSKFKDWAKSVDGFEVKSILLSDFIKKEKIKVDILKLNCEGAEYDIIEDLDKNDMIKDIREILVQFHKTGKNPYEYRKILDKTHERVYNNKWDLWINRYV